MNAYKFNSTAQAILKTVIVKTLNIHFTDVYKTVESISMDGLITTKDGKQFQLTCVPIRIDVNLQKIEYSISATSSDIERHIDGILADMYAKETIKELEEYNDLPSNTLENIQNTEWYKERPKIIQEAINLLPPIYLYRFKSSKKECILLSYEEPESGKLEDVTVTVQKTGKGGTLDKMGLSVLDCNEVFGVKLDDLERVN